MEPVVNLLERLGLSQYAQRFADNNIDIDIFSKLTDDDLRELGISSLGHRKKIAAAISELRGPVAALRQTTESSPDSAERRQLSVMFCDMANSTLLASRLDPEETRKVIAQYHAICSPVIAEYGGLVAKFMGDGILAYFGYPHAHEDDAERAVRAAIDITKKIAKLDNPVLRARIGIATGIVVVGEVIGEGTARERTVVGEAPNLAARLQAIAQPGTIVVAASTRRLVGDTVEFRDLGRQRLHGFTDPVEAWSVVGLANSESRFEATHADALTAIVGRKRESELLLRRLESAWSGEGQVVLVSGEAGIGKSRLAAWLAEQVAQRPHWRIRYQCSPYHQESTLHPVIQQLERAVGMRSEPTETRLAKLEEVLAPVSARVSEILPLFASLLSIPFEGRYPPLSLSPVQLRRQTLAALLEQLQGMARKSPVLVLFEDVHWADATSLELINLAVERVRQLPVLFLITFRPDFEPPWEGLENVTRIELGRMDQDEVETLAIRVTGGRILPAAVMNQIISKSDGVPLFVEELTKTIQESGILVAADDAYRLDAPLPPLAIPSTLHDSLMARLDRHAPLKEILQTAAAIGREFSFSMLQAVIGKDRDTLLAALLQLENAGMLFRIGAHSEMQYMFKHALVQDAAYESLLKSRRQLLHRHIGEVLRDHFADVAASQPEIVAHHFTEAGAPAMAIDWWIKAGERALRHSAFKEAVVHLGRSVAIADELSQAGTGGLPGPERLRLQIAYGNALISARGMGAHETTQAFARARELATGLATETENSTELLPIYYGLWVGTNVRAELEPMRELAQAFLKSVESRPDVPEAAAAHRIYGATCWFAGEFVEARKHLELALKLFQPTRDRDLAYRFGQDIGISTMANLTLVYWPLGEIDRACAVSSKVAAMIAEIDHAATLAYWPTYACLFDVTRRNSDETARRIDVIKRIAHDHEMPLYTAAASFFQGWVTWRSDHSERGIDEMRQGIARWHQQGALCNTLIETALAEAESEIGDTVAAQVTINRAIAETERSGQRSFEADTYRVLGEILQRVGPSKVPDAEDAFLRAIAVSRRQRTRAFELRAALGLAKLYHATGRDGEGRNVLAPALKDFAPTPEFPEIAEAEKLLGSLA